MTRSRSGGIEPPLLPPVGLSQVLSTLLASPLAWPYARLVPLLGVDGPEVPPVPTIDAALAGLAGVHFVEATPRAPRRRRRLEAPEPAAYDAAIVERGEVPTRPGNAHDLANALVWATFPGSKRALHARQLHVVRAAARPGEAWSRPEEGDALAMLDEGGIVILVPGADLHEVERELLRGDDAAIATRVEEGRALGVVFGHSIVEHLGRGESPGVAGLALALPGDPRSIGVDAIDEALAAHIARPTSFRTRRGHGIASVRADVLGTRKGAG